MAPSAFLDSGLFLTLAEESHGERACTYGALGSRRPQRWGLLGTVVPAVGTACSPGVCNPWGVQS